jgi:H+/Cl- antiporter ClcA
MKKGILLNQFVLKTTSFLPLAWLLSLYAFTVLCTMRLGNFPIASLNDPKHIGFGTLYSIVFFGFLVTFYGIFLWAMSFLISWFYYKHKLPKYLLIFLVGLSLMMIQIFIDPYGIIYWYLD